MKNKTSKQFISITLLIVILVGIGFYLTANDELLVSLLNISLTSVFLLVSSRFLLIIMNGLFLQAYASKFDVQLSIKEWFGLSITTIMGNYLTPFSGGMIARATYLKYQHAFPYTQFAMLLASNYLINFWVIGVIGLVMLPIFMETIQFYWLLFLFFLLVVILISILAFLPPIRLPWNYRLVNMMNTSLEGWSFVKNDKSLLAKLIFYTLVNVVLNGFSFWVAYGAVGETISFTMAVFIGLLSIFSVLLNITPGNFGIHEALVSMSSAVLGVGGGQGLVAALLNRSATVVLAFTLGPIFSYILSHSLVVCQPSDNTVEDTSANIMR